MELGEEKINIERGAKRVIWGLLISCKSSLAPFLSHRGQSRIIFQRLTKRAFLAQLERYISALFESRLSRGLEIVLESTPLRRLLPLRILGVEYAASLYAIPEQPPLRDPPEPCPHISAFFTVEMVRKAIDRLSSGRAQDHDGIVAEHFIHARDMIADLLALMFNRAMCEGFLETWSTSAIVPIFKSEDPNLPTNYRTIMIGHSLAKLYASILEQELIRWA